MSERDELIEWCRTRAQQANLAYEMHGQRPHEFHGQYAVDVARLCDALEEAEGERERLRRVEDALRAIVLYAQRPDYSVDELEAMVEEAGDLVAQEAEEGKP